MNSAFKNILQYVTLENITLALSIFGSLGTLVTFISSYTSKRKNLKIKFSTITYKSDIQTLVLIVTFENRSHLPIAVTDVSLALNKKEIHPIQYPHQVGEYIHKHGNEVVDRKFEYNLKFPVDIQQLSAASGYILFEIPPKELETLSTPLTVLVRSTRGRVRKIELKPNQIKWI